MQDKIKIAIIDSGIRLDHPAFAGNLPVLVDTSSADTNERTSSISDWFTMIKAWKKLNWLNS
jgi:hypothetical protein